MPFPDARFSERRSFPVWVATAGGIGYLRPGPGTWASIFGAVGAYFLRVHSRIEIYLGIAVLMTLGGTAICTRAARHLRVADPAPIVIDEIAGILWTYSAINVGSPRLSSLVSAGLGLILFRLFDIWKPPPVCTAEKLPAGWGIMADDVVAGVLAAGGVLLAGLAGTP